MAYPIFGKRSIENFNEATLGLLRQLKDSTIPDLARCNAELKSLHTRYFSSYALFKKQIHLEANCIVTSMIELLDLLKFDPFSIQDPFTIKIQSNILPLVTLKLRTNLEGEFISWEGVTMRADPYEGLELEYFFEGKDRDGKIIRTDIMKKIIEPPKSCINSFTIKEERVLMYCNFAFRILDFWTSDMIIELQVYDPSCGRWMKVSSTLRTEVPQIARELPKYEYDTVTWRISLLCGVSKFSAYSEPRVSLLPKKQIIKEGFTTQRFVYADRTLNYPPYTTKYVFYLYQTGCFLLQKKRKLDSARSYYLSGNFTLHEPASRKSDDENQGVVNYFVLFPKLYNGRVMYPKALSEGIQDHHPVLSIKELSQLVLKFASTGFTSAEFIQLNLVCRSWYNYVRDNFSISGATENNIIDINISATFEDWLAHKFHWKI